MTVHAASPTTTHSKTGCVTGTGWPTHHAEANQSVRVLTAAPADAKRADTRRGRVPPAARRSRRPARRRSATARAPPRLLRLLPISPRNTREILASRTAVRPYAGCRDGGDAT